MIFIALVLAIMMCWRDDSDVSGTDAALMMTMTDADDGDDDWWEGRWIQGRKRNIFQRGQSHFS